MKKIYLLFIAILFTSCSQNQNYLLEEGVVDIDYLKNSPKTYWFNENFENYTVEKIDINTKQIVETYEGTTARVILHEYDHMLGANFTHRVSKLKLERGLKAVAKKHKKHQRRIQRYLNT